MVVYTSLVPWLGTPPGVYVRVYTPGYTSQATLLLQYTSRVHRGDRLTALTRRVTERRVTDRRVTVLTTRFTGGGREWAFNTQQ